MKYKILTNVMDEIEIITSNEFMYYDSDIKILDSNDIEITIENQVINRLSLSRDVRFFLVDAGSTITIENCVLVDRVFNFVKNSDYFELINCYNKNTGDVI